MSLPFRFITFFLYLPHRFTEIGNFFYIFTRLHKFNISQKKIITNSLLLNLKYNFRLSNLLVIEKSKVWTLFNNHKALRDVQTRLSRQRNDSTVYFIHEGQGYVHWDQIRILGAANSLHSLQNGCLDVFLIGFTKFVLEECSRSLEVKENSNAFWHSNKWNKNFSLCRKSLAFFRDVCQIKIYQIPLPL